LKTDFIATANGGALYVCPGTRRFSGRKSTLYSRGMGRDVVLVLGAGASFGAKPDLPERRRPPIGQQLARYLREWFDANSEESGGPEWSNLMYMPSEWRGTPRSLLNFA
jgi:hypothetical protein